jgi:hypothetical protein
MNNDIKPLTTHAPLVPKADEFDHKKYEGADKIGQEPVIILAKEPEVKATMKLVV